MSAQTVLKQTAKEPLYDLDEQEERRETLQLAEHENYLEGVKPNPAFAEIREAFIRGDLDTEEAIAAWRELNGIPSWDQIKRRLAAGEKVPGY